jgi:hypothetical protein
VVRRIFIPKSEEVSGGLRKLYNEELNNLNLPPPKKINY